MAKVKVRKGGIHGTCVFADEDIKKGEKIIEYVGEKIDKDEAERRIIDIDKKAEEEGKQATYYIFELDKKYDIDGDVDYNDARFINHSCDPNCESDVIDGKIWILALRDIKKGEELTYDYAFGFDEEEYQDSPCYCGAKNCCGFIISSDERKKLEKHLAKKKNSKVK